MIGHRGGVNVMSQEGSGRLPAPKSIYLSILRQFTRNGGFWKAPFPASDQLEIFFAISLAMNERLYKFSEP